MIKSLVILKLLHTSQLINLDFNNRICDGHLVFVCYISFKNHFVLSCKFLKSTPHRHRNDLPRVEKPRDQRKGIARAAGDDQPILVYPRGIFGEQMLIGGVNTPPEDAPLAAVGVTRNGQVNVVGTKITVKILGMVAEQELIPGGLGVGIQPGNIRHPAGVQ